MTDDSQGEARYRAFISYSHKDAGFGRSLHRRLESYALPRRLVGLPTPRGPAPRRLSPIFRDREELPAAHDLSAEVRAALAASACLIVVCSPAAVASPWVAREIETFRALHPDRPVLAAVIAGEPGQCFPTPLVGAGADGARIEPLAADFRPEGDGDRLAFLKIVAGVAGVGLDQLIQRDAQRRLRTVTAVTAASVAGMLAMGLLTAFALDARSEAERQRVEAERQRGEAEGLVEFMLTDLRRKLKGVGRLDALTDVNSRALAYYAGQDLKQLPVESLERRARVYHAMGEDEMSRGDADAALRHFHEATRTTSALLAAAPDDPERLFNHGQSEYWFGYVDFRRERYAAAKPAFQRYKVISDKLVLLVPTNAKYIQEAGYAEGNICSMALEEPRDPKEALRACTAALGHMEKAAKLLGMTDQVSDDLINRHAWLADAYRVNGSQDRYLKHRLIEERILAGRMAEDPNNMDLKDTWIVLQRALAKHNVESGNATIGRARLRAALTTANELIHYDSHNEDWARKRDLVVADIVSTSKVETPGA